MSDTVHQLSTSFQPISKLEVHHIETADKSVKATVLISLINGIVKWWNYDNLSLYYRFNIEKVLDFSYYKSKSVPKIGLITQAKYINIFELKDFWIFSKTSKIKLKKTPLDFIMNKDKGIISYSDNYEFFKLSNDKSNKEIIETQKLLSKTLVEKTAPIIYLDSLRAFVISKSRYSYYVDKRSGSINKGSSIKIAWRYGTPLKVLVVRPYLIGLMEDKVEIKCLFNPNRVMQIIHDVSFKNCQVAVNPGLMEDNFLKKLDSIIIYSNSQAHDEDQKCHKLLELLQIDGK
jgi:hypothetical protein